MTLLHSLSRLALPMAGSFCLLGGAAVAQSPVPASYRLPRASSPIGVAHPAIDDEALEAAGEEETSWKLFDGIMADTGIELGGWAQLGFHTASNDLFNSDPDRINVQQTWLFAEKVAASSNGALGFGFRVDGLYGTDAGDTVSFGNGLDRNGNPRGFDAGSNFDKGDGYGFALPQAYVEVASGDLSVKAGHFYTLIGYEVVGAPGNFFYSHAITMYNSEPFTHTGVLGSYAASEDTTFYGGWTAGWDTGFDQFGSGSNFLGGVSTTINDDVSLAYMTTIGDFGARGDDGFMQSLVVDVALADDLNYVVQSDLLHVGSTDEDNIGINQYLFYTVDDKLSIGGRFEWWRADVTTGYAPHGGSLPSTGSVSYFEATVGVNYLLTPNVMLRPEYRYDWSGGANYNQGIFGFDLVATF